MKPSLAVGGEAESVEPEAGARVRGVAVLSNPYSGRGPNRKRVDALIAALEARGLQPRVIWDARARRELLADPGLGNWCRCVISAGGDGSLADVVNELAACPGNLGIPLATLPIGNENLFAREFHFNCPPQALAKAIERGSTRAIDAGAVGSRWFTLMVSAGFDADVVHRMAAWRAALVTTSGKGAGLRRVGRLSYLPRILTSLRCYAYPQLTINADGQTQTGTHLFVFNLPQYGGNLGIARHARCDDGKLVWVLLKRQGLLALASYGISVLLGRHLSRKDVAHGRAERITLESQQPVPIQADGDPAGAGPITIEVRPGALHILDMR